MNSVLVMMGTFNGAEFLGEQLDSIAGQTGTSVDMLVSDDGSTDATMETLSKYSSQWTKGRFKIIEGPCRGYSENYRHLILNSEPGHRAYAFSDQDDLWDEGKLEIAHKWLDAQPAGVPALHCGRTRIVDDSGNVIGMSPLFPRTPGFRNALVQSIAGGNTMVMNAQARDILFEACRRTGFVSHDWWAYKIVSGAGGIVRYEREPSVSYRQHDGNIIGSNSTWRARMVRLFLMASGRFVSWNNQDIAALRECGNLLSADAASLLDDFERIRKESLPKRLLLLARSGIHRQTLPGQFSLFLACLLGRI